MTTTKHVVLVDSRDRDYSSYPTPNAYRVRLPTTFNNVVSARLMSAEIPKSFHTFSDDAGNTTLTVVVDGVPSQVTLEAGNYTFGTLAIALAVALANATALTWEVQFSSVTNRCTLLNAEAVPFAVEHPTQTTQTKDSDWGLLYYLGFGPQRTDSDDSGRLTSPRPATFHGMSYILLDIDELRGASEGGMYGAEVGGRPLAKLIMDPSKEGVAILDATTCTFGPAPQQPRLPRLRELHVTFRFHDGRPVDFHGVDHSFALELETADPRPMMAHGSLHSITEPAALPHTTTTNPLTIVMKGVQNDNNGAAGRRRRWMLVLVLVAGAIGIVLWRRRTPA